MNLFQITALIIGILVILGVAIMLLWNWLIPTIFGLSEITFFQAVGLAVLTRLLLAVSTK